MNGFLRNFLLVLGVCVAASRCAEPKPESRGRHLKEIKTLLARAARVVARPLNSRPKIQKLRRLLARIEASGKGPLLRRYLETRDRKTQQAIEKEAPTIRHTVLTAALFGIPALVLARISNEISVGRQVTASMDKLKLKREELQAERKTTEEMFQKLEEKLAAFQGSAGALGQKAKTEIGLFNEELRQKLGLPQ